MLPSVAKHAIASLIALHVVAQHSEFSFQATLLCTWVLNLLVDAEHRFHI